MNTYVAMYIRVMVQVYCLFASSQSEMDQLLNILHVCSLEDIFCLQFARLYRIDLSVIKASLLLIISETLQLSHQNNLLLHLD